MSPGIDMQLSDPEVKMGNFLQVIIHLISARPESERFR